MECRGLTQEYTGATSESSGLDGHDKTFVPHFSSDRLLIPESDNGFLVTGDRRLGTGDRGPGTSNQQLATSYWLFGISLTNRGAKSSHFASSQYARVLAVFSA